MKLQEKRKKYLEALAKAKEEARQETLETEISDILSPEGEDFNEELLARMWGEKFWGEKIRDLAEEYLQKMGFRFDEGREEWFDEEEKEWTGEKDADTVVINAFNGVSIREMWQEVLTKDEQQELRELWADFLFEEKKKKIIEQFADAIAAWNGLNSAEFLANWKTHGQTSADALWWFEEGERPHEEEQEQLQRRMHGAHVHHTYSGYDGVDKKMMTEDQVDELRKEATKFGHQLQTERR